jgi:hypothetical protein
VVPTGRGSKEQNATELGWLGMAMTLLAAAVAVLAVLIPERRWLLWGLVVLLAAGALLCVRRALSVREGRAEPAVRNWLCKQRL